MLSQRTMSADMANSAVKSDVRNFIATNLPIGVASKQAKDSFKGLSKIPLRPTEVVNLVWTGTWKITFD
jgi:hypothetical protein